MAKRKLQRFTEVDTFEHVFHHGYEDSLKGMPLKGKWHQEFFKNEHPIVLELGCGKGEYTVGLAALFPEKNFIGIDIKGARLWRGAKTALENDMKNVAFLRTRIDFITSCFAPEEVSEIWLTFPDPQPQESRERKRLTAPPFVERYKKILKKDGIIHLKTDSRSFYEYTLEQVKLHNYPLLAATEDLYHTQNKDNFEQVKGLTDIQTFYEKKFSEQGFSICYVEFKLEAGD